ncbi:MobA/MobL family protein (plasmid) [Klebsiella quasipneumoniae]|uniref:MobA/MobL family protein n=1 Tax=Klebsiella quasipneumoniae TaxID=1463165 RepID=UPI0019153B38|nr:MobA/MobL family protein [Klebsiella quasipneumoniae]
MPEGRHWEGDRQSKSSRSYPAQYAPTGAERVHRKTREFDARSNERDDDSYLFGPALIEHWRERFALLQNLYLARAGVAAQVDHRSNKARGLDVVPTRHLGPAVVGFERRMGIDSEKRQREALAVRAVDERVQELDAEVRGSWPSWMHRKP